MKLLVTGAGGMLAGDVVRASERAGHSLVALTRAELDITNPHATDRVVAQVGPDAILNCAAWTDVDGAESERDAAAAVNVQGPGNLAHAATEVGVQLVHVSTDYVFSGEPMLAPDGSARPYVESDQTGPRSVYGRTKLEGERLVLGSSATHTVVRSSWLFGIDGRNFVDTMLRLAGERGSVQVVDDQVGCPTWTGHLAPALIGLVERGVHGLVHLAGAGHVSWNGLATEIFRQAELDCRVDGARSSEMDRPAPRPAWSALATERTDVIPMGDWRDGLAGYLAARTGIVRA